MKRPHHLIDHDACPVEPSEADIAEQQAECLQRANALLRRPDAFDHPPPFNPAERLPDGRAPIHVLAGNWEADAGVVEAYFMANGSDNALLVEVDLLNKTALHHAIRANNFSVVEFLLNKLPGAAINSRANWPTDLNSTAPSVTPLHLACSGQVRIGMEIDEDMRERIVELILAYGAEPNTILDLHGHSAIDIATESAPHVLPILRGWSKLVEHLGMEWLRTHGSETPLAHDDPNWRDADGDMSIHVLVSFASEHTAVMEYARRVGRRNFARLLKAEGQLQRTPLHCAVANGRYWVVKALLMFPDDVVDVNAKALAAPGAAAIASVTPLHIVCSDDANARWPSVGRYREWIIELLVHHGADLEARNENGETPAEVAERAGLTNVLNLLTAKRE